MGRFVRMGVVMRMRVWMRVRMNLNGGLGSGMRMFVRMVMVVRNGVVVVVAPHAVCDPELAVFATVAWHA